jgi:hypothetical protein
MRALFAAQLRRLNQPTEAISYDRTSLRSMHSMRPEEIFLRLFQRHFQFWVVRRFILSLLTSRENCASDCHWQWFAVLLDFDCVAGAGIAPRSEREEVTHFCYTSAASGPGRADYLAAIQPGLADFPAKRVAELAPSRGCKPVADLRFFASVEAIHTAEQDKGALTATQAK